MNAVIVEDNLSNLEALLLTLKTWCPDIRVVGHAASIAAGTPLILDAKPDIVFLDVELTDGYSFKILEKIPVRNFAIIFVTGFSDFIYRAFEFSAVDYLMKPIEGEKLKNAVDRARQQQSNNHLDARLNLLMEKLNGLQNSKRRIALSDQKQVIFRQIDEIILVEAQGAYCNVFLEGTPDVVVISKTIKEYTELFEPYTNMIRVHRSYLVNLDKVEAYVKEASTARMSNGKVCPVSHRDDFLKRLGA